MTIPVSLNPRPKTVKIAVVMLSLSVGVMIVTLAAQFPWSNPPSNLRFYIGTSLSLGVPILGVWLIYKGMNWVRWVFLIAFFLGMLSPFLLLLSPKNHTPQTWILFSVQTILQGAAAIALLSGSARKWFSKPVAGAP